jgi:hypothetical protein
VSRVAERAHPGSSTLSDWFGQFKWWRTVVRGVMTRRTFVPTRRSDVFLQVTADARRNMPFSTSHETFANPPRRLARNTFRLRRISLRRARFLWPFLLHGRAPHCRRIRQPTPGLQSDFTTPDRITLSATSESSGSPLAVGEGTVTRT